MVCIMTGGFQTDYSRMITQSASDYLRNENIDVCLIQGLDAARYLGLENYVDHEFDRHYYSRFEYSKFLQPDLLIVSFGTISSVYDPMDLKTFLAAMPSVPVILLEVESDLPGTAHITTDNYAGMKECVEHLIRCHGFSKMLYVSGPKGQPDAEPRLKAFQDAMTENGLQVSEDMIVYGDFTDRIDDVIREGLERMGKPDAIVCANDEMAVCAYRVLRSMGLTPGKDVAVTGFDDTDAAGIMTPPLTTVRQDQQLLTDTFIHMVHAFLNGEVPPSACLPARLVIRSSCGCVVPESEQSQRRRKGVMSLTMEDRVTIKQMETNNILTSLLLRSLLTDNISIRKFFGELGHLLSALGTRRSRIGLLKEPIYTDGSRALFIPDEISMYMIQDGGDVEAFSADSAPVLKFGAGDRFFSENAGKGRLLVSYPLFYGNIHYGVFMAEVDYEQLLFYYTLSLEIGTGLRYLFLALEEQNTRADLERKNTILEYSSTHDNLTGLLNRSGAEKQWDAFLKRYGSGHQFAAVISDMDHLKQINDTFGHNTGDSAIRTAADILRTVLPAGSPVARTGGDEFTALFLQDDLHTPEWFRATLARACDDFNDSSHLPYRVKISAGCRSFSFSEADRLDRILKETDVWLYEDKKKRDPSVIRVP